MADAVRPQEQRAHTEAERDRRARREAARLNAQKGVGRNLEEAIRLVRAGDAFRDAFRPAR